jgi:hypothetical protein
MSEQKENIVVTYNLPTSVDTEIFGPVYWAAFHDLASKIPCGICKEKMEQTMIFVHDLVNQRLGKSIHNPENFKKYLNYISKLNNKPIKIK